MPLSKQAKALYEAALRKKGLQPGKAVRQDPRTFVGPIRTYATKVPSPRYNPDYHWEMDAVQRPYDTYWNHRGRLQDLEDELQAAIDAGVWERRNSLGNQYYRYYNDGDMPKGIDAETRSYNEGYNDPNFYRYYVPRFYQKPVKVPGYGELYENRRRSGNGTPYLTRLGELELEARADEMIENDYKDYLKKMFEGKIPVQEGYSLADVYDYMPYDVRRNYYERLPYYYRTSAWPDRREYHKTKEGMEKGMREARNIGYSILDYGENPNAWTIQDMIEGKTK